MNQNDLFLYCLINWEKIEGDKIPKSKINRDFQKIIKFFKRISEMKTYYYISHGYLKDTIIIYTKKDGSNCYSTNTIGLHLHLKYFDSILKVDANMIRFKEIIEEIKKEYPLLNFEIYLGAELQYYDIKGGNINELKPGNNKSDSN